MKLNATGPGVMLHGDVAEAPLEFAGTAFRIHGVNPT